MNRRRERRRQRALRRWLRHERAGDEARAEEALHRLLVALPRAEPPAGFAERVLRAGGMTAVAGRGRWGFQPWIWRAAFAIWLLSSFLVAVGTAGFFGDLARSKAWVGLGSRALVELSRLGAELATALHALVRAGEAVATAVSGPTMLTLVVICALSSLASLGALSSLMAPERSSRHA